MSSSPTSTRATYSLGPFAGASTALKIAKEARADMPNVQQILGVAISILELAEKVEKNESMCALAWRASALACVTSEWAGLRPVEDQSEDLACLEHLERLKGLFTRVKQFMAAEVRGRNRAMMIYRSLFILPAKTYELWRDFGSLGYEAQRFLFAAVFDRTMYEKSPQYDASGQFRVLRDHEVRKLDVIREHETHDGIVTYAKARVDGVSDLLIVKYIRVKQVLSPNNNRSPQQYITALSPTARTNTSHYHESQAAQILTVQICHPNVARLYGRARTEARFTVIDSGVYLAADALRYCPEDAMDLIERWHSIRLLTLAGAHYLERMDIAWLPQSHEAIVVDDSGKPTIGAFDDIVPRSAVSAKLQAACVVAALNELSYLVFAAQENLLDSANAAAPDLDYDNHSALAYESMMAAVPDDLKCIDTTIVSSGSGSVGAVMSDIAADSREYWEELEIRRKSDEPPPLNRNTGTAGPHPVEFNSQPYDLETQIQYFHAAEGPSSSDYENTRGVYLSFRYRTSSSALGTIFSSQEYTQQNGSMETFFTALNTVVTVATSYHTAKDFGNVYITDFPDFLTEFRDLDITDQIKRVSPLVCGIGGTASVRQASYRDQPVAIKVVPAAHANEKSVKRLAREIAVWRTLSHKNVLPLYGLYYYAEERVPAMVSPWCANGNIVEYLAARSHLPEADMAQLQLRLLLDTLEGLACLHHERVVHGDLKGPNILVLDDGTACVADFGVSAVLCDHPQSASAAGTFRWMAPELLDDDNQLRTRESDMWAFGCVMVEIISGKPPFHAIKKEPAVIIALFGGATPQRPPQASEMMWECCQECFRQRPEDRLTADILLLRLRAIAEEKQDDSTITLQEPHGDATIATSYEGYSL